jgi:hypothetical protein
MLRMLKAGGHFRVAERPQLIFESGQLPLFERPATERLLEASVSAQTAGDEEWPALEKGEALALAVLSGDKGAAAAALADYLLEEEYDWAEAAAKKLRQEGAARERERVRNAAFEFAHEYERRTGEGYGRHFRGNDVTRIFVRSFVIDTIHRLHEQAAFVASGESLKEWETRSGQFEMMQSLDVGYVSRGTVFDEFSTISSAQFEAFVAQPELAGASSPETPQ